MIAEDFSYRQTSPPQSPGRIRRGIAISGRGTKQPASIPSKFETFLNVGEKEKNGFGTRTYRFEATEADAPGPGQYVSKMDFEKTATSLSKRGYGNGFVSKSKRWYEDSSGSLASSPNGRSGDVLSASFDQKQQTRMGASVRRSTTVSPVSRRNQTAPSSAFVLPGPGQYSPGALDGLHRVSLTSHSVFRSTSRRLQEDKPSFVSNPGPGQYDPDTKEQHRPFFHESIPSWEFRSRSIRSYMHENSTPGPGAYNPKKPGPDVLKTGIPRSSIALPPSPSGAGFHKHTPMAHRDSRGRPSESHQQTAAAGGGEMDNMGVGAYDHMERYEMTKVPSSSSVFVPNKN